MHLYKYLMIKQAGGFADAVAAVNANMTPDERHARDMGILNGDLYKAREENADLLQQNQGLQGQVGDLQGQVGSLKGQVNAGNARINELDNMVGAGDQNRMDLIMRQNELEGDLARANSRYGKLEGQHKDLEGHYGELEGKFNSMEGDYKALQERHRQQVAARNAGLEREKGLQGKIDQYDADLADRNAKIEALNGRVDDYQNKMLGYRNDLNEANGKIYNQQQMLADNDATIDRMRRNASIGGAVAGAGLGGTLGYAGSNWLGNRLGLSKGKSRMLTALGIVAGAGLGGYGGYQLGKNI